MVIHLKIVASTVLRNAVSVFSLSPFKFSQIVLRFPIKILLFRIILTLFT